LIAVSSIADELMGGSLAQLLRHMSQSTSQPNDMERDRLLRDGFSRKAGKAVAGAPRVGGLALAPPSEAWSSSYRHTQGGLP
jgi:hypothetical protein